MKFSIIIPVYNAANYLEKCLNSVVNQTYDSYEAIIINDGSIDNSLEIIKKYKDLYPNKFKVISKENEGLSSARNTGVLNSSGEYLLFLDSDDFLEKDLLDKLKEFNIEDVVRFQANIVDSNYLNTGILKCNGFEKLNGNDAFMKIFESNTIEPACFYMYKRSYFIENDFKYSIGRYHEDFGLTILVILKAKLVSSIEYIGYNYYQSENSIMRNNNYNLVVKKSFDMLYHFDFLKSQIDTINLKDKKIIMSFISNAVISKLHNLKNNDFINYKAELKKRRIVEYMLSDSLVRKIKKQIMKRKVG